MDLSKLFKACQTNDISRMTVEEFNEKYTIKPSEFRRLKLANVHYISDISKLSEEECSKIAPEFWKKLKKLGF